MTTQHTTVSRYKEKPTPECPKTKAQTCQIKAHFIQKCLHIADPIYRCGINSQATSFRTILGTTQAHAACLPTQQTT